MAAGETAMAATCTPSVRPNPLLCMVRPNQGVAGCDFTYSRFRIQAG